VHPLEEEKLESTHQSKSINSKGKGSVGDTTCNSKNQDKIPKMPMTGLVLNKRISAKKYHEDEGLEKKQGLLQKPRERNQMNKNLSGSQAQLSRLGEEDLLKIEPNTDHTKKKKTVGFNLQH